MAKAQQTSLKEQIVDFLEGKDHACSTERIRRACDQTNWRTVHRACLELHMERDILAINTDNGYVFRARDLQGVNEVEEMPEGVAKEQVKKIRRMAQTGREASEEKGGRPEGGYRP